MSKEKIKINRSAPDSYGRTIPFDLKSAKKGDVMEVTYYGYSIEGQVVVKSVSIKGDIVRLIFEPSGGRLPREACGYATSDIATAKGNYTLQLRKSKIADFIREYREYSECYNYVRYLEEAAKFERKHNIIKHKE